jgi:hypothetical protein
MPPPHSLLAAVVTAPLACGFSHGCVALRALPVKVAVRVEVRDVREGEAQALQHEDRRRRRRRADDAQDLIRTGQGLLSPGRKQVEGKRADLEAAGDGGAQVGDRRCLGQRQFEVGAAHRADLDRRPGCLRGDAGRDSAGRV